METFHAMIDGIGKGVPAWLPLILLPSLLAAVAIALTLFGGRKFYRYIAALLGGIGFFFVTCIDDLKGAFVFLGLYIVLAAALRLLFFIPRPFKRRGRGSMEREEKIYRKFRESLTEQAWETEQRAMPLPDDFEEEPHATAEEYGAHLSHATELLSRLKKMELSPTDRLETDALSRSVEALRGKPLSEEETGVLNDCLASVLKLTAKYKL
ncbi:MAG: hypothetical protein K2K12_06755 [Clostridia bacterium]|nr:hypothetical protein [Clostridia bacterium]